MADFFEDTKKEEQDDDDLRLCSSMECTGLIPALPENEDQLESYEELYPFLPPVSCADDAPEQAPPSGKNPSDIKG